MTKFLLPGFLLTFAACGSDSKKDTGYESILGDHTTRNGDDGSNDTGGPGGEPDTLQDSCILVGLDVCYETNEPDNEDWCEDLEYYYGIETIYGYEGCAEAPVVCDIPAGGDFTAAAVGYMNDPSLCSNMGGTVR